MIHNKISLQLGASPSPEEIATASFLLKQKYTKHVTFITASRIKGVHTPDIEMNGLRWEIKAPTGKSPNTIKHAFKIAQKQSANVIFDLRQSKITDQAYLPKIIKEFHDLKSIKRLLIITKTHELLDYHK